MEIMHHKGFRADTKGHAFRRLRGTITFLLFLTFFTVCSAGQSAGQQVTFNYKNTPLADVLIDIAKQSKHQFFYNASWLKDAPAVTLQVSNMHWEKALTTVLADRPFVYKIIGEFVYLNRRDEANRKPGSDSTIQLQGRVLDDQQRPLPGVTVGVKGTSNFTKTDDQGAFSILVRSADDILQFSSIGFERRDMRVDDQTFIVVSLKLQVTNLEEVVVPFNTGYQIIARERATGAFSQVGEKLYNRSVGRDALSRINGLVPGIYFNPASTSTSRTGINIRGQASLSGFVNSDPLIVLDNFPYEGDLSNINPNDIESVTILKDAAAASIWGARAGNGVIVLTSKKGAYNQKMRVGANVNFTVGQKPDLYYDQRYVPTSPYMEVEKTLFDNGYFDQFLQDKFTYPAISPAVEIWAKQRAGTLTAAEASQQLNALTGIDLRQEYNHHLHQRSTQQQYAVNVRGGGPNQAYYLGVGYDKEVANLVRNDNNRFTIRSEYLFTPIKKLEVSANLYFTQQVAHTPNNLSWGNMRAVYAKSYPYARLADEAGNPMAIAREHNTAFLDSLEKLGFLNWRYRPLEEIGLADRTSKLQSLILRGNIRYKITPYLNIEAQYQREFQDIDTRNLQPEGMFAVRSHINGFAQYNPTNKTFKYPFPRGGILDLSNNELESNNFRTQINLNKGWSDHEIIAVAGAEIRQTKTEAYTRTSLGYDDEVGSAARSIDYVTSFPINGGFNAYILAPSGDVTGTTQRFLSYFANAAYTYKGKYTLTISGRRDGANIFGVKTNDRITPFWHTGISWDFSKENFYHIAWMPSAKLRATYGYNGNVYPGGAYLTAVFGRTSTVTNQPIGSITTAPNPELRWEKIGNLNIGLDFRFKKDILYGSIDWYEKTGKDLLEEIPLATSTGFTSFRGNAASSRTRGIDLALNTTNLRGALGWTTNLVFSFLKSKITSYNGGQRDAASITSSSTGANVQGHEILSLYSYRWAGLDPVNGDPQGYLGKSVSKDYSAIVLSKNLDSLVDHGSTRPRYSGALRNNVTWKGLTLSANVLFKFKYVYRRSTVNPNLQDLLTSGDGLHLDYLKRWQKPGDEAHTSVPSMVYLTNLNRTTFYRNSEATVSKGDHIRLQDVRLSYDLGASLLQKGSVFTSLQVYFYANNLGIIWKANKDGLDPDFVNGLVNPKTYAVGVSLGL
ncbi:SusC/RagA family TonB-linked outer membrane protein [Pseudoflavitalea sp. X16]|uniref:SusC/RagA family TonB-linked outer membrane protein n=1 Tax=Paraflavitalea devenefica TaxID=2716334 RepID=UPI00141F8EDC|nr:SusC/RagA family TonB-linked outer membrane protein [Paraflavitalea devenefica]NII26121.1 SusC/RagA family TonB-linked outer membrane protein [Paraflavitalea devenefica]